MVLLPPTATEGLDTLIVTLAVLVQPPELTVTLYPVFVVGETIMEAVVGPVLHI